MGVTACSGGGSDASPTGPSSSPERAPTPAPIAPATIQLDGNGQMTGCSRTNTSARCDFQETGRNVGPGCATSVRVTIRFMAGEQEVAVERWSSGSTRVLLPEESFNYSVRVNGSPEALGSITQYGRQVEWTSTRCPA